MFVTAILFACTSKSKEASIVGVYNLDKQFVKMEGKDSVILGSQIKIYTPTHFIWANLGADSSVSFGFGSYVISGENITRNNIYSSRKLDSTNELSFSYKTTEKGYSQTVNSKNAQGLDYQLIEEYSSLAENKTSPSDLVGAWKQVNTVVIDKNDTSKMSYVQYKVFQNGYFMFVNRYATDSTQKTFKNGFGCGKYTFKDGNLEEVNDLTTSQNYKGVKVKISVKFNGKDEYAQTIVDSTKTIIETYIRVK